MPDTVQFFKKFCSRSIVVLLDGTKHGSNEDITKLLYFPSLRESSCRIEQYFHSHPISSNSDEVVHQPPTASNFLQLCLSKLHEMLTIDLMNRTTRGEIALEIVPG